jgi:alkanesulfonate monooxygenase SsuD/methylene tetrahydromethanopterin reductase-like flavin-dependent oxidoreductase (luciferase family)
MPVTAQLCHVEATRLARVAIRFGAMLLQAVPYPELRDDSRFAESLGLDVAWIADHFGVPSAPDLPLLEAWTTLGALAVDTSRIRIGTLVTNIATRNPALLAKQALTVDRLSGGRLDVGVGAGYYADEHAWIGVDFLDGPGRSERLAEAVEILDRGLRGERVTLAGRHFRVADAPLRPEPVQTPRPPLYVGAQGPKAQRIAARHADAVVMFGEPAQDVAAAVAGFRERNARLDGLCADAGRDPATLGRCYFAGFADEPIFASADATADFVGRFAEAGATEFSFYLYNPAQPAFAASAEAHRMADRAALELAARDVFPAFR